MRALLDALIFLCSDMIMLNSLYRLYGIYFDRSVVNRRKEYLAYGAYWLIHFLNYDLVGLSLFHALGTGVSLLALAFLYPGRFSGMLVRVFSLICLLTLCEVTTMTCWGRCGYLRKPLLP